MSQRPVIFISAVSKELRSARGQVARLLQAMGYDAKDQDMARTEHGGLRAVLRKWIDQSEAVIQLVGECYGYAPPKDDPEFGRCSYTQFEALYACKRGKPVWYFFAGDGFTSDPYDSESEHLRALQRTYREGIHDIGDMRHVFRSSPELENCVHRIEDRLEELRREWREELQRARRFRVFAGIGILAIVTGITWLLQAQRQTQRTVEGTDAKITIVLDRQQKMEQALARLADAEMHAKQTGGNLGPEQLRASAYALLERELGLSPGTLAKELPAFALELYNRDDTTPLMRARAAYALNKFADAEALFLEGATQAKAARANAQKVADTDRKKEIEALVGAGQSAEAQWHLSDGLRHYVAAEALTSRERDPAEWAGVQLQIANAQMTSGQFREAEAIAREAGKAYEAARGAGNQDALRIRSSIASAVSYQGRYAEAEQENRAVLRIQERVLGPEHPDTLGTRHNLAATLFAQAKFDEAERELRTSRRAALHRPHRRFYRVRY